MLSGDVFWDAVRDRPSWLLLPLFEKGVFSWLGDAPYLKLQYWAYSGKRLDIAHPRGFNEKIAWIKVNDHRDIYRLLADKYEARDFVAQHLGADWLIPLLGSWDTPDQIDFSRLPERFVLKCTNGYGGAVLCRDAAALDRDAARRTLAKTLKTNFYRRSREWAYRCERPRVICEELIDDGGGARPADYKFMCMNGRVAYVCLSRGLGDFDTGAVSFFDREGRRAPFKRRDYPDVPEDTRMPDSFASMRQAAELLARAADVPFVRVDFYEVQGHPYFSEFTFYPCGGTMFLEPERYDRELGDMLQLPCDEASAADARGTMDERW